MPKKEHLKKVLVIGSGPIVIGQAAEFDYAGTQACKALREEGVKVVLVNSNPATIMTDADVADAVYIEPLNVKTLERVIAKEHPDGILASLGGQTGLNLAIKLVEEGVLEKYNVELLGTSVDAIKKAEDRELFRQTMLDLGEPIPESAIISDVESALQFARKTGYPLIIRPAYTLGGTGGGIATDEASLREVVGKGIKASIIGQVLLEQSVAGWKEVEYEVMRDSADTCITICNMENFDPVGIHTGDSIVVAPTQTLSDKECQMLRNASLRIIRELKVEGGCNIQFALNPKSMEYIVIEVNPRVSRSSALASKATGYPIAKMAGKIAIGLTLSEIKNPITEKTSAAAEPTIDYIVVKAPRWPFDKFATADRFLGTQMKATGEVMAIDRSFEGGLMKAIRSLEIGAYGLKTFDSTHWTEMELEYKLEFADDERIFCIAEAFRRQWTVQEIAQLTKIDRWFLMKIQNLVQMEVELAREEMSRELLKRAKELGFSDKQIANIKGVKARDVRNWRLEMGVTPVYKVVDTCAGEFEAVTPYYYSCYDQSTESLISHNRKVLVLGSGPIRIGQGIEFDYCSVHSAWALKSAGVESIVVNNNPETVSTDFDTSDKLYFEPLVLEDVLNIVDVEKPMGVIIQFGGQTAINLAAGLREYGVPILGTSVDSIDRAEDRKRFEKMLGELGIPQSEGRTATKTEEAIAIAEELGYPVLVRPSYVIGGRAMEVVSDKGDMENYISNAVKVSPKHPVLIDKYIRGKEVEVDAISDGDKILIPGIMEHIERAGVHSGDSMAVYPPQGLTMDEQELIVDYTKKIALALEVRGILNIQFVVEKGSVYIIEVNPRASRTVPIISKVTGIPMVKVATNILLGATLKDQGYSEGLYPEIPFIAVKAPVFSFEKLGQVDISLGPEMKSTGEVMGLDISFGNALLKAMVAGGTEIATSGKILVSMADKDKEEVVPLINEFVQMGFTIMATPETANYMKARGVEVSKTVGDDKGIEEIIQLIKEGEVNLVLNTPTKGKLPERMGFKLRRAAADYNVPCLTSLDTAKALLKVLKGEERETQCNSLQYYLTK
ncbi:carbamoyl-phosphate synthase large subunit [Desulfitispora alkaliphila]|uniref:carbamoyl-phosphate synthase large subunit n=1 Tax=Desulfitispora alkaliphila TaxID=622674 RepID=UPI003D1B21BE